MRSFTILILTTSLACCRSADTVDANRSADTATTGFGLADSVERLAQESVGLDSLNYISFLGEMKPYKLLYFNIGNLYFKDSKNAIALYSVNDTTIEFLVFEKGNNAWTATSAPGRLFIYEFSPAFFRTQYEDFNFDGIPDLYVNFYTTVRVADSHGYVLTFDADSKSLKLHEETVNIPNISVDRKTQAIISTEFSNPNDSEEQYKIVSIYRWTEDTLKLTSTNKIPI